MTPGDFIFDLGPARALTLYETAREARAGRIPPPRMAILYPNYGCNCRCAGCEYELPNSKPAQLPRARMLRLLKELRDLGVASVEFCGGGEPSLYPHLADTIRRARDLGLSLGLLTNATGLRGGLAALVARELSYVRISLDAARASTYEKVHHPPAGVAFDDVLDIIREILRLRAKARSPLLVSIKFLVSRLNLRDVPAAFDLARDLGVDSLQFKALRRSPHSLTPAQQARAAARIRALRDANPDLKVLGGVDKVQPTHKCWLTPAQVTIDARGDVFLCCYYLHRAARHRIGNIHRAALRDIWGSPRHAKAIAAIRPAECARFDCRFVSYMKTLDPLVADPGRQADFI